MRISETEPSSVILSLTKYLKIMKSDAQKCQNFDAHKSYESTKATVDFDYMWPRGLFVPPEVTITKKLKFKNRIKRVQIMYCFYKTIQDSLSLPFPCTFLVFVHKFNIVCTARSALQVECVYTLEL